MKHLPYKLEPILLDVIDVLWYYCAEKHKKDFFRKSIHHLLFRTKPFIRKTSSRFIDCSEVFGQKIASIHSRYKYGIDIIEKTPIFIDESKKFCKNYLGLFVVDGLFFGIS